MGNLTLNNLLKRINLTLIFKIFTPGILLLVLLMVISRNSREFNFSDLSRDPLQLLKGKPYIGVLSRIGIVIWCATSAILLFSSLILKQQSRQKSISSFLFFAGLLTFFLMIDDYFMFHDIIVPEYFKFDEKIIYFLYGLSFFALIYFFRKVILDSDYIILLLSVSFLGISILTDIIDAIWFKIPNLFMFEDGFKFLGIIGWFAYFTLTSYKHTKSPGKPE